MISVDDWTATQVQDLASQSRHSFTDGDWIEAPYITDTGIRLIQTGNIGIGVFIDKNKKFISEASFNELKCKDVCAGDILICRLADPIGRSCVVPNLNSRSITSVDVCILRVEDNKYDRDYIAHALNQKSFLDACQEHSGGSTRQRISRTNLGKLKLLVPELKPEQTKIAEILSTVDRAIEESEALIAKQQRIKTGLMLDLLTRGIDEHGNLRSEKTHNFKDSPLGRIPVEWEVELLDSLAVRGSGHTPNKRKPAYWNGGIKWVSLADSSKLDQVLIAETDKEISALGLKYSSAVLHPKGTVILSRDAGVGKSAILAFDMAVSQHFMAWRCKPLRLDNFYLYYWLQRDKPKFEGIASGSTIVTIGLQFFKEYVIAAPKAVTEQQQISNILRNADIALRRFSGNLVKLMRLKTALMQDLLTGKKRVTALLNEMEVASV